MAELADRSEEEQSQLQEILIDNMQVFSNSPGVCNRYVHRFRFKENIEKDFRTRNYPIPSRLRQKVDEEIETWKDRGIISSCQSRFLTPLLAVPKKDGSVRLCGDYRTLNNFIDYSKDSPEKTTDLFQRMAGKKYFTVVDLASSFHQVKVAEEQRKYLAFIWKGQVYAFNVVPFGTNDSLSALVKALNQVFDVTYDPFLIMYVDDLLIASETWEEHLTHINKVMKALINANMRLKLTKCQFVKPEINFLGFIFGKDGMKPDPGKIEKIKRYPVPKNQKEVRGMIGYFQWYSRFYVKFAELIRPFLYLTSKNQKFEWNAELQEAFERLKNTMIDEVVLSHPMMNKDFYLVCDASSKYVASVLYQLDEENRPKVLYFFSKTLSGAELKYSATEKEMLAILYSLEKHESLIAFRTVHIITDCKALVYIKSGKWLNQRFKRWLLKMQNFKYTISHVPGSDNVADRLSRLINEGKMEQSIAKIYHVVKAIKDNPYRNLLEQVKVRHSGNPAYADIREKVKTIPDLYKYQDGLLTVMDHNRWKIYLNEMDAHKIAEIAHVNYGHIGIKKLYLMLRKTFAGKYFMKRIKEVVKYCATCQKCKTSNQTLWGETATILTKRINEAVSMDFLGPLIPTKFGHTNILVITDNMSQFTQLYTCKKANSTFVLNSLQYWINNWGKPLRVIADNATCFRSKKYFKTMKEHGIKVTSISNYHPNSNLAESRVKIVGNVLRIYAQKKHSSWYQYLPMAEKVLNHTVNTRHGFTPAELFIGNYKKFEWEEIFKNKLTDQNLDLPMSEKQAIANDTRKAINNKAVKSEMRRKITQFHAGERVLIKIPKLSNAAKGIMEKMQPIWEGVYVIDRKIGMASYLLRSVKTGRVRGLFHVTRLKKYWD